jgi:hypothetical protein
VTETELKRLAVQCGLPIAELAPLRQFERAIALHWVDRCVKATDEVLGQNNVVALHIKRATA